jgi:pectate lyase
VTLTASPGSGYSFLRWAGTAESRSNPYVLAMNAHTVAVGVMMTSTNFGSFPYQASPSGFASVGALGYPNGTTGGAGADSHAVYVTSATELNNLMLRRLDANGTLNLPPLTVYIVGILSRDPGIGEMLDVKDAYDLSIIGVGGDATITGFGLKIVRSSNIIVRNIRFASWPDDGINIQAADNEATGHHIWIDHCTFTDIPPSGYPASSSTDGALDVTHTAAYITLSWNRFENHDKTMLIGHSNSQTSDTAMKITVHHNWFNGTGQRHPRVRFGKVHVFNNHFSNNTLYGVSSNMEADVMVEGNYFMNVPIPTETSRDGGPPGDLVERYNIFVNSGPAGTRGDAFEPSVFYSYALDSASTIPAMLASYAGSGKYDFSMSGFAPSVVFGSFSGQAISGNVQLEWTTFSENNNLGFNVQRKRPADTVWTDLPNSFIPGQGTTTTPQYYSFTDSNVASGLWNYRLKHQEIGGAIHYTDAITVDVLTGVPESVVHEFALHQNYPNPFNPETSIRFTVAQTAMATLVVYNMLGQEVATLFNDVAEAGRNYVVQFSGSQLATGVYFYRLQSSGKSELRKFVLLK